MKTERLFRTAVLALALAGMAACSSAGSSSSGGGERRVSDRQAQNTNVFYFEFDVAEFRTEDRGILRQRAQHLAANPNVRIRLEGHADERGTREYNLALGERRAEGIRNFLVVNGASRSQIEVVSYGEERPANRGTSQRAYRQNRRVEVVTE